MNAKLTAIAEQASEDLKGFIKEAEKNILDSWAEAENQAELDESKPKLKLGFSITLDLDKDHMETALTFGIKYKLTKDAEIPDPNQLTFPTKPAATVRKN